MISSDLRKKAHRLTKIHIMIVDNDEKVIALLTTILTHLGFHTIFGARDGFEAVRLLKKEKFDLIITDWQLRPLESSLQTALLSNMHETATILPIDGAGFVRFVRTSRHSPNPYLSIIMLVGQALQEHIEYARDAGVNEVVVKPVNAESLCERIAAAIDRHGVFVTSVNYRGPCRRRRQIPLEHFKDRRKRDIRIIPHNE